VAPDKGLGYVRVNLVYVEASYRAQRTGQESDIKVPAILNATIEVTTNKKKGKWDGLHEYTAEVSPPAKLTSNQISGARLNLQRDLLAKVVKQVSSNTKPARRAIDVAAE
jgi:hypothetical protein